eukprot:CAMPEP_0178935826 /NCGR_PEP_ID=MMETSP0786-20121207/24773_1 /TAXON_ID=186022 /ORGANISM="Thalassionema frauenfeldii, Strain CCMP 1798" /LENGTH=95 /DNA_ID=CAMNT_0020614041 /DNA_START=283 /DNA_END=567 /DNA_ORIENTATION=-
MTSHSIGSYQTSSQKRGFATQLFSKKTNDDDHREKSVSPFSICTWNVWFENTHNRQRMLRISQRIADKNPTFVGFQEVTPELFSYLRSTLEDIGY